MPSFFEGLKRVVSGQPVFRPDEDVDGVTHKSDQIEDVQQQQSQPLDADVTGQPGPKIIPEVYINRVEYRNSDKNTQVDVEIKNRSEREVFVDRINILGNSRQISLVLRPGEEREVSVYDGPRFNHRNYTNCDLQYRDQATGDYFSSLHNVEYEAQETDGTYNIRNIRFNPPIKDI